MTKQYECKRCGWCCEHIRISCILTPYLPKQEREWHKIRGIEIKKGGIIIIKSPCPYLNYNIDFQAYCEIQERKTSQM